MAEPIDLARLMGVHADFMEADRRLLQRLCLLGQQHEIDRTELLTELINHQVAYNAFVSRVIRDLGFRVEDSPAVE